MLGVEIESVFIYMTTIYSLWYLWSDLPVTNFLGNIKSFFLNSLSFLCLPYLSLSTSLSTIKTILLCNTLRKTNCCLSPASDLTWTRMMCLILQRSIDEFFDLPFCDPSARLLWFKPHDSSNDVFPDSSPPPYIILMESTRPGKNLDKYDRLALAECADLAIRSGRTIFYSGKNQVKIYICLRNIRLSGYSYLLTPAIPPLRQCIHLPAISAHLQPVQHFVAHL